MSTTARHLQESYQFTLELVRMNLPVHSKVNGNENEGAGEQVHLGSQDEKVNISENLQPSCSSA